APRRVIDGISGAAPSSQSARSTTRAAYGASRGCRARALMPSRSSRSEQQTRMVHCRRDRAGPCGDRQGRTERTEQEQRRPRVSTIAKAEAHDSRISPASRPLASIPLARMLTALYRVAGLAKSTLLAVARPRATHRYVTSAPSPQQALDIFKGEWAS